MSDEQKGIADLKVGDTVWLHTSRTADSRELGKKKVIWTGTVTRCVSGWIFVDCGKNGKCKFQRTVAHGSHDDWDVRFVYGQHTSSKYAYSNEASAVIGEWAQEFRHTVAAYIEHGHYARGVKVTNQQLLAAAAACGFLEHFPDRRT